jgi:hypothetical protein
VSTKNSLKKGVMNKNIKLLEMNEFISAILRLKSNLTSTIFDDLDPESSSR